MSRSNPQENGSPNPATRWFEWNGENGVVRYYDKEKKETVEVGSDFTFLWLDELGSVRGWHESSKSGIYSNEVKDTRQDVLIVKAFKGGTLAEGLYKDIKDRVNSVGGQFNANCYIAFKNGGGQLALGSIRFKGAALGSWMEFRKAHRADLLEKAVRINGFTEGKKGRITYRMPVLSLVDVTPATNDAAIALDKQLQSYLAGYLKKNKRDQVEAAAQHVSDEDIAGGYEDDFDDTPHPASQIDDSDIPF
jgi:hypothetical protein